MKIAYILALSILSACSLNPLMKTERGPAGANEVSKSCSDLFRSLLNSEGFKLSELFSQLARENEAFELNISMANIQNAIGDLRNEVITDEIASSRIREEILKDKFFSSISESNIDSFVSWIKDNNPIVTHIDYLKYSWQLRKAGIDPDGKSISFAKMARIHNMNALEHITNTSFIFDILQSGKLAPALEHGNRAVGGSDAFVYLRVVDVPQQPKFSEDVAIEIELDVLDNFSWSHASPDAYEGEFYDLESVRPSNMFGFLLRGIKKLENRSVGYGNEILFSNSIPLENINFKIRMDRDERLKLLDRLKTNGVIAPAGRQWDEIILLNH